MSVVSKEYQKRVNNGELEPNEWQKEMTIRYDALYNEIIKAENTKSGFLRNIFVKKPAQPVKGFYIYGKVGRGKTMLMDLFYECIPIKSKMRAHFNDFMQDVQNRINHYRKLILENKTKEKDALELVAQELYEKAHLLCFDEFSVTDIADAMILSRLFSKLFAKGVVLVATSNVAPKDLYLNGLNRELFLPFIPLLEKNCTIIDTLIDKDFRLDKTVVEKHYLFPINSENKDEFLASWQNLTKDKQISSREFTVKGRKLLVKQSCSNCALFDFADLCASALSVNDYIEIANNYKTIFIENVPIFNDENVNWAKRFILLIDVLYERNNHLVLLASADINDLYIGQAQRAEKFEFARTCSRLYEMQSKEYLSRIN